MIHLGEKCINHAYLRLNSEQALTPMERDLGVVGDGSQKSSGHCAAGAKTASFCSDIKVEHAHHVFEYRGCPSVHTSRKRQWRQGREKGHLKYQEEGAVL